MKKNPKVRQVTQRYLDYLKGRRRKPATIAYYESGLKMWDELFGNLKCRQIKQKHYQKFLKRANHDEHGNEWAPNTQRRNIGSVQQWQQFAMDERWIKRKFERHFDMPPGRKRRYLPTAEDVQAIRPHLAADFEMAWDALRLCGARPGELCRATVENWNREKRVIVLRHHKTERYGKERRIPVCQQMEDLILKSLGSRNDGYLFVNSRGEPWSTNSLGAAFRRARDAAGLNKKWINYTTRKEFATDMRKKHGDRMAAELIGQEPGSSSITHYSIIEDAELSQVIETRELIG